MHWPILQQNWSILYSGPYRVTQVLSDVNYRLANLDTGQDAGVYHVVNMQPFQTWNACSSHTPSGPQDGSEIPMRDWRTISW